MACSLAVKYLQALQQLLNATVKVVKLKGVRMQRCAEQHSYRQKVSDNEDCNSKKLNWSVQLLGATAKCTKASN